MEASLHGGLAVMDLVVEALLVVDMLSALDMLFSLELCLLVFSCVHLHFDLQVQVLVQLIQRQVHAQSCFLYQHSDFVDVLTYKNQCLVNLVYCK